MKEITTNHDESIYIMTISERVLIDMALEHFLTSQEAKSFYSRIRKIRKKIIKGDE